MATSNLLSVIIPVYNAEKYLQRCINSILNQTYNNLEILLINDGSTDLSPIICDDFAKKDNRVRVFHQQNVGQGITRKRGVDYSTGEYIAFVDDDDYIRPNMYEHMLQLIKEKNVDICACLWNYETENGYQSVKPEKYKYLVGKYKSLDFAHLLFTNNSYEAGIVGSPWNKIYKRYTLKNIISEGKIGEDEEMIDCILTQNNISIYVDKHDFYVWCFNSASMSHKPFTSDYHHRLDINYNRKRIYKNDPFIVNQALLRYCNLCIEYYYATKNIGKKFPFKYKFKLLYSMFTLFFDKYNNGYKLYIRIILFLISPFIYKKIILK